jgi:hypothetical protein
METGRWGRHQGATWTLLGIALLAAPPSHAQIFQNHYSLRVQSLWSGYTVLGLSVDPTGGIAIAGGTGNTPQTQNAFLLKLDASGTPLFHRNYSFNEADGIAASLDGGYFIVGHRLFNDDPLVFKTDAGGNVIWARSVNMSFIEQGFWGVSATPDGGCVASGIYSLRFDAGGNVQWSKFHHVVPFGCSTDGANNTTLGGIGPDVPMATDYNFGLSKLDPDGHVLWSRAYGAGLTERAYFFTPLSDGGYILAGNTVAFIGPTRALLMKITANGTLAWSRTYTTPAGTSRAHGVVATPDGGAVFTGVAAGRIMLARIDANGAVQWSWSYEDGTGYALASTPGGGYALAGVTPGEELLVIRTDALGESGCETELQLASQSYGTVTADLGAEIPQSYTMRFEAPTFTNRDIPWTENCAPVATRLESFLVAPRQDGLEVRWRWSDPADRPAIALERSSQADGTWGALPNGYRSEDGWWFYLDRDVEADRGYSYRLIETLDGGSQQVLGVVTSRTSAFSHASLAIGGGTPSVGSVSIQYSLNRSEPIEILLSDVSGRRLATLVNGWQSRGSGECTWDGFAGGRRAAAGVYYVTLQTGSERLTRQVVLLR